MNKKEVWEILDHSDYHMYYPYSEVCSWKTYQKVSLSTLLSRVDASILRDKYNKKYDIMKYKGKISIKFSENKAFLYFKNKLMNEVDVVDVSGSLNYVYQLIQTMNDDVINRLSFEYKEKDLKEKINEYHKYVSGNHFSSRKWIFKLRYGDEN